MRFFTYYVINKNTMYLRMSRPTYKHNPIDIQSTFSFLVETDPPPNIFRAYPKPFEVLHYFRELKFIWI